MKLRYFLTLLGLLGIVLLASPVQAGGDVSVCDEAHLLSALSGGGTVTFSCSGTITLSSPLSIDEDTVVDASGQNVTISGGGSYKVVFTNAAVTLRNLTIANGYGGVYTSGGGVINTGDLILDRVTIANNGAGSGGGIDNLGNLTIMDSTIRDNLSLSAGTGVGGNGAGIFNQGNISISSTTLYSNYANTGGAIYNLSGTIDIVNSTFYENSSIPGDGAAIYNSDDGTVNVINSTFSRNEAGQNTTRGTIDNSGNGDLTLTNSVVANPLHGENCNGTITDGGGNLSFPDDTCPGINLDPVLGPLQDNGGQTLTLALLDGSSAIDNAIDSVCNAAPVNGVDQRGVARPIGEACDIGAYESNAAGPEAGFVIDMDMPYTYMCLSGSAVYDVDVLSVAGFSSAVDLSVNNLPNGMSAAFDTNPVVPTASTQLTISDTGTAATGAYSIDVMGNSGTITDSLPASLYVYDTVPDIQPALLTPADGVTNTLLRPTFSWEPIAEAIYYDLEVATDVQFNNIVFTQTTLVSTYTPYNPLQEGTQYYWRVKARNQCGEGPFSEPFTFTTYGTAPETFIINPSPSAATVCLSEDAVFDITVTGVAGFDDPVTMSLNGLPDNVSADFDHNPVVPPDLNYLTLNGSDPSTVGEYSIEIVGASATVTESVYVFLTINPSPPAVGPTLLTPTDGMTNTQLMPTLSWQAVENASIYKIEVATDSSFNNTVYSITTGQLSHTLPPMEGNTQYYWRVTPQNSCGVGAASEIFTFTTTEEASPVPKFEMYIPLAMMENKD